MKNLFEKLQDYFNNTSEEQILKDWKSTEKFDNVNSPLVEDFIDTTNYFCTIKYDPLEYLRADSLFNTLKNPNFSSDFLFTR